MIRGMGLYAPESVKPGDGIVRDQEADAPLPAATLVELKTECLSQPDAFVWVGLFEPTKDELDMVADVFGLPTLLVEDAANASQRPKFEFDENGHGLALLKILDYTDSTSDVHTGQLAVFVGPWFAVTVRIGEFGDLRGIRKRLAGSRALRSHGPVSVLYAVLDLAVDGYLAVTEEVVTDVEELESEVFTEDRSGGTTSSIYRLKRENVEIRRAIGPLVVWAHDVAAGRVEWMPGDLQPYFRDVGDHLLRVSDSVEATDNLLMAMFMASTSLQDLQQNQDMRKISAWVAIAAVPTVIAGIYGMNFEHMPELHERLGYPIVLGLMAVICITLFSAFKRSGWL